MSTNIKDYYYILGVGRDASKDEIKKVYRKLSIKFHPDQNNGDKFFEERFKDILEAYETLSNDVKRKIYDERLQAINSSESENYSYNSSFQSSRPGTATKPPSSFSKRKRSTLYVILAGIIFLGPFIKFAVNKINETEKEKKYDNLYKDATYHTPGDSVILLKVYGDTETVAPPALPNTDTGHTSTDPPKPDNDPLLRFKDDDGLTAEDAVNYFFDAFNNSNCYKAWNMTYNNYWVQQGEDWFCSSHAFGGVKKVLVKNIYVVSQYVTVAQIHIDYYAEDSYNGNKCFKQTITVQKIEYTDSKLRWKVTKMQNDEEPFACNENQ